MSRADSGPDVLLAELAADLGPDGVALLEAESVDALHILLLSGWGPRRRTTVDAELLFRAHHARRDGRAVPTALLLLTDRRWEGLTGRLVDGLIRTQILTEDDLDALALQALAGQAVTIEVDARRFSGLIVVLDLVPAPAPGRPTDDRMVARRRVPPLLRRWAAARATGRALLPVDALLRRADQLPARGAADVVRGILEQFHALPSAAAGALLEKALAWPAGDVRAAALSLLIDRGDTDRAAQLGTDDADADVRRKIGRRLEDAAQTALF